MIEFAWPAFGLVLFLPLLWRYLLPAQEKQIQDPALQVPFFQALQTLQQQKQTQANHGEQWQKWLLIIAYALLVLAATRPQWLGETVHLPVSGRELMLAVDLSGSMQETDLKIQGQAVDRLSVVKAVLSEFIERRAGDRLGLILFADVAYLQTPLTFDRHTVATMLQEAFIGMAGEKTAIGDAIIKAIQQLKDRPEQNRVLILLTDGRNSAGSITPRKAAELAKQTGVKIYSIGVGADKSYVQGFFGKRQVNPSRDLDEKMLTYIAEHTGGRYFRARDVVGLQAIYQQLDALEPIETETDSFRPMTELYFLPLTLALLFAVLLLLTRHYRPSS